MTDAQKLGPDRGLRLPAEFQELLAELNHLRQQAMKDGGLDRKTKELAALGMAVVARCNTSTVYHLHNALEAGATRAEIAEIIGVAVTMAGESVAVHGVQALRGFEHAGEGVEEDVLEEAAL